ncbi:MAG TPA: SxtJ family membrane protein [Bacteroidota bacterium]|nr:SxtJ family membrane protein [Bacteroidota bacterium]
MNFLKSIGSKLYKGWMAFARGLAVVNTILILSIVYLFLIGPSWFIMKIRGKDLLDRRSGPEPTFWKEKEPIKHTLEQSKRQF